MLFLYIYAGELKIQRIVTGAAWSESKLVAISYASSGSLHFKPKSYMFRS